jgi:hypothetical protein
MLSGTATVSCLFSRCFNSFKNDSTERPKSYWQSYLWVESDWRGNCGWKDLLRGIGRLPWQTR